jgi:hypothetical protein
MKTQAEIVKIIESEIANYQATASNLFSQQTNARNAVAREGIISRRNVAQSQIHALRTLLEKINASS